MPTAKSPKKGIHFSKEEWFLLFLVLMRKVFPKDIPKGPLWPVSLGKDFPQAPRSKALRSYYPILSKIKDMFYDNFARLGSENLHMSLELTAKEIDQIKELLLAAESDPVCEDPTRLMITRMRSRINT